MWGPPDGLDYDTNCPASTSGRVLCYHMTSTYVNNSERHHRGSWEERGNKSLSRGQLASVGGVASFEA